jgi:hypothetical protein
MQAAGYFFVVCISSNFLFPNCDKYWQLPEMILPIDPSSIPPKKSQKNTKDYKINLYFVGYLEGRWVPSKIPAARSAGAFSTPRPEVHSAEPQETTPWGGRSHRWDLDWFVNGVGYNVG